MNENNNKNNLSDYTKDELDKLSLDQVQQLLMETIKEIVEVSQSATQHINQLDEYRKIAEQSGDGKTADELGQIVEMSKERLTEGMISCNETIKEIENEGAKTLSIFNQTRINREKSFVETMSSGARAHDEYIQSKRNERYEQMIEEAGELESPSSRLHR